MKHKKHRVLKRGNDDGSNGTFNPKPKQETNKTNIRKAVAKGVGTDDERTRRTLNNKSIGLNSFAVIITRRDGSERSVARVRRK